MSRFVVLPDSDGNRIIVNLDHVVYAEENSGFVNLIFGKTEKGRFIKKLLIDLEEFLAIASDKV